MPLFQMILDKILSFLLCSLVRVQVICWSIFTFTIPS